MGAYSSAVEELEDQLDDLEQEYSNFVETVKTVLVDKFIQKLEEHKELGRVYSSLSGCDRRFFEDSLKEEINRFVE